MAIRLAGAWVREHWFWVSLILRPQAIKRVNDIKRYFLYGKEFAVTLNTLSMDLLHGSFCVKSNERIEDEDESAG